MCVRGVFVCERCMCEGVCVYMRCVILRCVKCVYEAYVCVRVYVCVSCVCEAFYSIKIISKKYLITHI